MPPTEKALAEQFRRCEVVARAKALQAAGLSQSQAARELGVAPATLSRWLRAHARGGDAALLPRTQRCGRKALAVEATEEDRRQLKRLRLATGSDALALQMWADDARCSEGLRAAILKPRASRHNLPASLRQLCHVTAEEAALFRGHRTFELAGFIQRRDDTKVLADGRRVPLEPGDLWELDDMSLNQPFWWESEAGGDGDALSRRQGAAVGRQVLFAQDVASGRWLGFELVGRPRDAYRAADILRFIRRLIEQHGMPRIGFRLEGGIWRARAIAGITLDERGNTAQRPAMADEQRQALFGGLQELGLTVDWCHSPHHKGGIESGFNYLQSVLAAVSVMEGAYVVDLGRHRGEFERGTKALMAAHAGRRHPRELGFWHIEEARERLRAACARINAIDVKEGRIQRGVADVAWARSVRADPLRPCPQEKLWVFLPNMSACRLRGGHVAGRVDGVEHLFCAPELFAELGSGYPVHIRFDATEPSLGAWVFNAAPREHRANVRRAAMGELLGWAAYALDAPQFDAARGFDASHRRRYTATVRSSFQALGLFGRKALKAAEHRDGAGGVSRIEARGNSGAGPEARGERLPRPEPRRPARPAAVPDLDELEALEARLRETGALI